MFVDGHVESVTDEVDSDIWKRFGSVNDGMP